MVVTRRWRLARAHQGSNGHRLISISNGLAALTPNQIVFTVLVEVDKSATSILL